MEKVNINPEYVAQIRQLIGRWVFEFRKERGLTQEEVGRLIGVSKPTVCKIEAGKWLSLEVLIKLAARLNFYIFLLEKESDDELAAMMRSRWDRAHFEN